MKIIHILLIICLYLLTSCDNREKKFIQPSTPDGPSFPELVLSDANGKLLTADSIKLSLKSMRKEGTYTLTLKGGSALKDLTSLAISGSGILTVGTNPEGYVRLSNGSYPVVWKPTAPGTSRLKFTMVDDSKTIREAFVDVATFDNLPPVANFQAKKINQIAVNEYLIDASSSYDKDQKYGGYIKSYEYTVEGKTFVTKDPSIKWIFSTSGSYPIKLKVTDGDDAIHSVSQILTITI